MDDANRMTVLKIGLYIDIVFGKNDQNEPMMSLRVWNPEYIRT